MKENRFTLDPDYFSMPVPENLPTIEELEWYQAFTNWMEGDRCRKTRELLFK